MIRTGKGGRGIVSVVSLCLMLVIGVSACKKSSSATSSSAPDLGAKNLSPLAWNLKTIVDPYQQAGYTNVGWDDYAARALTEFARVRARVIETNEDWDGIISSNTTFAVKTGCQDPMVNYLYVRFAMDQTNSPKAFSDAFLNISSNMMISPYPPIRKFYASDWALDQLFYTYGQASTNVPGLARLENLVMQNLLDTLQDKSMPAGEAYDACETFLTLINGPWISASPAYARIYGKISGPLFENWPNAYTSYLLKGEANIHLAWAARGVGFANTVTPKGAAEFAEKMAIAGDALRNAWRLNPYDSRIANNMLEVEGAEGNGDDEFELWFDRAMALDPNDYTACSTKLNYISPKWYGSTNDMLEFGRECATNTQWGGHVPLVLLDAHYFVKQWIDYCGLGDTNYWRHPEVWADLHTAFERYFQVNPNDTGRYDQYAWYAYQCGQWQQFLDILSRSGREDYDYFGGKSKFDQMVQNAKDHLKNPGQ